jgi:hypothetical protein
MRGANMKIIKYLIKKNIYIFELQNNSPDKILDVINLLFSVPMLQTVGHGRKKR